MYLIGLLDPTLITFTNSQISFDFLNFSFSFLLVLYIELKYCRQGITYRTDIMIFLLFHMFIHALHTHYHTLLLTIEHKWLLMDTTLDFHTVITSSTFIVSSRLVTPLPSVNYLWRPPLSIQIRPTFSIGHFPQSTLTDLPRCISSKLLFKFLLTQLWTFHIHKQQFLMLLIYYVLDV